MAAPDTIDDFLDLVRKSNQIDTLRLDAYVEQRRQGDTLPPDPKKFAALLVREGLMTNFQAEQLLQGRYKGFTLGGYRIIERVGAGGTGTVYLAEHEVMKRRVALKVVPPNVASDPSVLERFRREAQAAAVLDHPNIVRAYDFRQEGQLHVLVMEYVNGPSLEQVLQSGGPMSVPVACEYVRQAALGLDHAHAQNMVHRDIKPGNLLVDPTGLVKILDMGLARFSSEGQESVTQKFDENTVMGTADYLAPEQAINLHDVDHRADIYSLGATLYALLAGAPPFAEGTVTQKLLWHQMRDPAALHERRPEVPSEISALVTKMMAKDPAARFAQCAEIVEALAPFCAATPTPQGPARPGVVAGRNTGSLGSRTGNLGPSTTTRRRQAQAAQVAAEKPAADRPRDDDDDRPRRRSAQGSKPEKSSNLVPILALVGVMLGVLLLVGGVIAFLVIGPTPAVTSSVAGGEDEKKKAPEPAPQPPQPQPKLVGGVGLLHTLSNVHGKGVSSLACAVDGVRLASAGKDGPIGIWSVPERRQLSDMKGHAGGTNWVTFAPRGNRLLSAGADKSAKVWDIPGRKVVKSVAHEKNVLCAVFGRDEKVILTGSANIVRLFELEPPKPAKVPRTIHAMYGHKGDITGLAYRGGRHNHAVSSSNDGTLKLWDLEEGKALHTMTGHSGPVSSVAVSPDGQFAISGGHDSSVRLWNLDTGAAVHTFAESPGKILAVAFSPDGQRITAGGADRKVFLWDVKSRLLEQSFLGHVGDVTAVTFTPDSKQIVSGGLDRTIRVWGLPPAKP